MLPAIISVATRIAAGRRPLP